MKRKPLYRRAVGLEYEGSGGVPPLVLLKGDALLADEVVRLARRFGVPVVEDGELARLLDRLPEDEEIPEELFQAVAVLLSSLNER